MKSGNSTRKLLRYVLSRFLLILFGILLALICLEIALRILPVPNRFSLIEKLESIWEPDSELLLHLKPNQDTLITGHPEFSFRVQTNADGLRDEAFTGSYDIAAIGDSFTFGFGVAMEESWPKRLETQSGLRVANLGWAGWNSYVYPSAIRRYAIPLETHVWIWTFFGNDLPESTAAQDFRLSGASNYLEWTPEGVSKNAELPFPFSLRSFQFFAALVNPELFLLPDSGSGEYDEDGMYLRYGTYAWQMTDPEDPQVQRGWELTEAALEDAADLASRHEASLVVVFIPNREHVYWPYLEDVMPDVDVTQLNNVAQRLADFCDVRGIYFVDLLPAFRERALAGEMLYFPADGHWNVAGHELAANEILEFLIRAGLVDKD
ncbi:MAG: GDSL-type esterase/lipase family protein [Anaerolineales bacterium]|jgi:hypothetical protein